MVSAIWVPNISEVPLPYYTQGEYLALLPSGFRGLGWGAPWVKPRVRVKMGRREV